MRGIRKSGLTLLASALWLALLAGCAERAATPAQAAPPPPGMQAVTLQITGMT